MSERARVYVGVAAAAVVAAALVVATVAFTRTSTGGGGSPHAQQQTAKHPGGPPPLELDLGVRTDPEAIALRRANALYDRGERAAAARVFARYHSLPAQLGAAIATWPNRTQARLEALARAHPRSASVLLHLGLVRFWRGDPNGADEAWRDAVARDPDTASAVRADDFLHPTFPRGLPEFTPDFPTPARIVRLSPPLQIAALRAAAVRPDVHAKLLYGLALQRLGKPVSAEREFAEAAALAPNDPEALTAAAVGKFSKSDPARAFSQLGPLARRFPRSATVRLHLGKLLLWLVRVKQAERELALARRYGRGTIAGREANAFLQRLRSVRTS